MQLDEQAVKTLRFLAVDAVEKAKSGHPGAPMALAGITTDLFTRVLRYNPEDPEWPNRDRFVLSCGHASMLLYGVLHLAGYPVTLDDLKQFRQYGSKTPGHPEHGETAGVETTTGPLGQGLSNGVGMALAGKMLAARFNASDRELFNYRVFVLASDGDMMEGVSAEAASLAGHWGLGNLKVIYDDNKITIDGSTDIAFSEDVQKRFEAYGWEVQRIDGHDPKQVSLAIDQACAKNDRPQLIIARTHIGFGAPNKQDSSGAHGTPLGKEEVLAAKKAQGWPEEPEFLVPEQAYRPFRERVTENVKEYESWKNLEKGLPSGVAADYAALRAEPPADLFEKLCAKLSPKADATRNTAGRIQQEVAVLVPGLVGGSADLDGSTKTKIKDSSRVTRENFEGRNVGFGVREHAMGAICNGLALSGFVPFASTFLIFSDYMRPSIRLAALMKLRVVYVFTHDSIFVGEDGPTHQPVEQVASLRLIPNLDVLRPADDWECAAAWAHAATRSDGPCAFALTRQNLPVLERPSGFDNTLLQRGAYILDDAEDPELVLIASGSEVHVALEAKQLLAKAGKRVRVVSAPCLEQFERQSAEYQSSVLGGKARRVSIELGTTSLWRGIVGLDGISIGLDRFGASGPYQRLAEAFGFTGEKVAARILEQV